MTDRKIPSFTIIELIVTMLISSIVIGIIYTSYLLFNRRFIHFKNKSDAQQEFFLMKRALAHDMDRAVYVKDSLHTRLVMYNKHRGSETTEVVYFFSDSLVLRSYGMVTDTLCRTLGNWQFRYVDDSLPLVNRLNIQCTLDGEAAELIFTKQYDAQQLIKSDSKINE
jgi:Tfp pilus assembly protein PilE